MTPITHRKLISSLTMATIQFAWIVVGIYAVLTFAAWFSPSPKRH